MSKLVERCFSMSLDGFGAGEHLMQGIDLRALGYECVEHLGGSRAAAHITLHQRA